MKFFIPLAIIASLIIGYALRDMYYFDHPNENEIIVREIEKLIESDCPVVDIEAVSQDPVFCEPVYYENKEVITLLEGQIEALEGDLNTWRGAYEDCKALQGT